MCTPTKQPTSSSTSPATSRKAKRSKKREYAFQDRKAGRLAQSNYNDLRVSNQPRVALFRGVVNATQVGVFIDDANKTEDANGIAALNFIRTTSTTIALLIWGVLIDEVGSEFLLAGAGLLAVAAGAILMPMIRRSTIATTE